MDIQNDYNNALTLFEELQQSKLHLNGFEEVADQISNALDLMDEVSKRSIETRIQRAHALGLAHHEFTPLEEVQLVRVRQCLGTMATTLLHASEHGFAKVPLFLVHENELLWNRTSFLGLELQRRVTGLSTPALSLFWEALNLFPLLSARILPFWLNHKQFDDCWISRAMFPVHFSAGCSPEIGFADWNSFAGPFRSGTHSFCQLNYKGRCANYDQIHMVLVDVVPL